MTISDGYIDTDKERGSFRINQKVYADQRIFEEEAARVFDRCWLYSVMSPKCRSGTPTCCGRSQDDL